MSGFIANIEMSHKAPKMVCLSDADEVKNSEPENICFEEHLKVGKISPHECDQAETLPVQEGE